MSPETQTAERFSAAIPVVGVTIRSALEGSCAALTRWSCRETGPGTTSERVQHRHVIAFVHSGSFRIHAELGDGLLDASRVAYFNAGRPYRTSHPVTCGDRGSALVLAPEILAEMLAEHDPSAADRPDRPFPFVEGACSGETFVRQRTLLSRLERHAVGTLEAEEEALKIARLCLAATFAARGWTARPPLESKNGSRWIVEAAREYIASNYFRPLRLAEVAREVGVSPFHLSRVFSDATGVTLHRHVTTLRLRKAIDLLPRDRRDLTGLALDLGFSSHSHFSAAFGTEFGVSPSRYRARSVS